MYSKFILIILFCFSAMAANYPATQINTGGSAVGNTNPFAIRLSDGTGWLSTLPVSASSLPLPTGAATESTLSTMSAKLPLSLGSKAIANSMSVARALDEQPTYKSGLVQVVSPGTSSQIFDCRGFGGATIHVTYTGSPTGGSVIFQGSIDGVTYFQINGIEDILIDGQALSGSATFYPDTQIKINLSGIKFLKVWLSNITGVSTVSAHVGFSEAISTLAGIHGYVYTRDDGSAAINSKTPALGQALMAASRPVVIASNQTAIPVSGTVTANAGTNLNTSALALETTQTAMSAKLPATLGTKTAANSLAVVLASDQATLPVSFAAASALFKGRTSTFNTPGRAGTTGQKIQSIYNAAGSPVKVVVKRVLVDLYQTVAKAVTVAPPIIRVYRVTVQPTNGTALTKNKIGGTSTSSASVIVLGDASGDNAGSASTLTATLPAGAIVTQEYAPRLITAAGYEAADRLEFFDGSEVVLAAGEGLVLTLDYTLATQNPTTDRWIAAFEWEEN